MHRRRRNVGMAQHFLSRVNAVLGRDQGSEFFAQAFAYSS
jgi:hypothetical protein